MRLAMLACAALAVLGPAAQAGDSKLDSVLGVRAAAPRGFSRVIVRTRTGCVPRGVGDARGAQPARHLSAINAVVVTLADSALESIARDSCVLSMSADRPVRETDGGETTSDLPAPGARWVRENLGLDGTGVGIAMLDSGVTSWHDDLTGPGRVGQRVVRFVDFVQQRSAPYDDYGHGTHVAGILAGNGTDSEGEWTG
ncbi:MAG: S8 family serine peptidase, partial [Acidobacteriota bacterium]